MPLFLGHVKGHAVGTGIQVHLVQILMHINVRHDPAGKGIVLEVIDHAVHLIEHSFLILMLYTQLIAVCLADAAVLIRPLVPDMAVQVVDVV